MGYEAYDPDRTVVLPCQCSDPGCPHCGGSCDGEADITLFRRDADDHSGTLMCEECAADAFASGVFSDVLECV